MVNYRRYKLPGGTYFFTVTLKNRNSNLLITEIDLLREAIRKTKRENPFIIHAMVILPEHIHTLWELPQFNNNYAGRWRKIKSYFTSALLVKGYPLLKNKHGEYNLWQRRFWEHTIKDDMDYKRHVNYIHYNPVKHGYVKNVNDWQYSTFHQYVERGILPQHWSGNEISNALNFGE